MTATSKPNHDYRRASGAHGAALADNTKHSPDFAELEISAWDKLLAATPTTLAGLGAMLEYVTERQGQADAAAYEYFRRCRRRSHCG